MRCTYCGSMLLHPDTETKRFSAGKAAAGAVAFGPAGAAAGLIGKERKGYRCGACGAFMDSPMNTMTESSIDSAIREAESGKSHSLFDYFKQQYPNIQAKIPTPAQKSATSVRSAYTELVPRQKSNRPATVKSKFRCNIWQPDAPIYIRRFTIQSSENGDVLLVEAYNQSKSVLRSAYYQVIIYDDTGDKIGAVKCVYQGMSIKPGEALPEETVFPLHTDIAYRVELIFEKAAASDDHVWRGDNIGKSYALTSQTKLSNANFPRLKYVQEQLQNHGSLSKDSILSLPIEKANYWQCICGHPVKAGDVCSFCGMSTASLHELLSQQRLQQLQQERVKNRAAERAEKSTALYERAVQNQKADTYSKANALKAKGSVKDLEEASRAFHSLADYKDSAEQAAACQEKIKELKEKEAAEKARMEQERAAAERKQIQEEKLKAARKKKHKQAAKISAVITLVVLIAAALFVVFAVPPIMYSKAQALEESGNYQAAALTYEKLGDYRDAKYKTAQSLENSGDYQTAALAYGKLGDYQDAKTKSKELWNLVAHRDIISIASNYAIALRSDGTVVTTGIDSDHDQGQCDVSDWTDIIAVSAGYLYSVGLKSDGTVVIAGGEGASVECDVSGWTDIVAVSAGGGRVIGLKCDGTVVASGNNDDGECDTSEWSDIVAIAAGADCTVGLKADGTVVATGNNEHRQCNTSEWSDIVAIAVGVDCTVGLKADGTVVATGYNGFGQCNVADWDSITSISCGGNTTAGLKNDGTVVMTGYILGFTASEKAKEWSDMKSVSVYNEAAIGLKSDGDIEVYASNYDTSAWENIKVPQ